MRGPSPKLALAAAAAAGALCWPGAAAAGAEGAAFTPCAAQPGFSCATVPVPLDRSGRVAGTIGLSVERRYSAAGPSSVAVLALAGGPGQAALPLAPFLAEAIAPGLSNRDLLLFDERGTGASGALSCTALGAEATSTVGEAVERCAHQLGPARGDYTSAESAEDIEAVRRAAGYQKLILYGTSYGTKVALEYAARHPQNVAGLLLDSTLTPEGPEAFMLSSFRAIRPALAELCSNGACAHIARNPLADLARVAAQGSAHPLRATAYDGHGRPVRVTISSGLLFSLLLDGDLNPALRAEMPAALHAAVEHDLGPLARMITLLSLQPAHEEGGEAVDTTLFLATSCEETRFPWQRGAPEATRAVEAEAALNLLPSSDFYPFGPETALFNPRVALCVSWPDASPAPAAVGAEPSVPTLILSGAQDLRTPTDFALQVAATIPCAQVVRVPYTGHSVIGSDLSGCARAAVTSFFSGEAAKPCAASRDPLPPAPLAPRSVRALPRAPRLGGLRGRTVSAIVETLRDLHRTLAVLAFDMGQLPSGVPFGGLRGGSAELASGGIELRGLSYVPGVRLTGLVPTALLLKDQGPGARLRVSAGAQSGTVRIAMTGRVSGVLGGRAFAVALAARTAAAGARGAFADGPVGPRSPLARIR